MLLIMSSVKWRVTRVMLGNLCKISAWRSRGSRRILDRTLIEVVLSWRKRYSILSRAARKVHKKIITIYIYQRAVYRVIMVFAMAVNSRCYVARICGARVIGQGRRRLLRHTRCGASLSLSLSFRLFYSFLITVSCPHARPIASQRFMKSSGMRSLQAHRGALELLG